MVQIVKSLSMHTLWPSPALASKPIAIDNGLPHITFFLGSNPTLDPTLCGLMDTCGAPIYYRLSEISFVADVRTA
jgi:hypothetical protein